MYTTVFYSTDGTTEAPVTDAFFTEMVCQWIAGFHGNVATFSAKFLDERVRLYLHQELI